MTSAPDTAPFPDESFDLATAWSVFEHVTEPRPLLRDVRRVLRPGGVLFIQVWPLWFSEHGSHLWPFFDETFVHLTKTPDEIREHLLGRIEDPALAQSMYDLYESCNRHTVDDIQSALIDSGFGIGKLTLTGASLHVPPPCRPSRRVGWPSTAARSSRSDTERAPHARSRFRGASPVECRVAACWTARTRKLSPMV